MDALWINDETPRILFVERKQVDFRPRMIANLLYRHGGSAEVRGRLG